MELLNLLNAALDNYFKALEQFGYKKESDVDKLLALTCIEELTSGEMKIFITEEDYRAIERAVYCLLGSTCLMPYPSFVGDDNIWGTGDTKSIIRFTEDNNVRVSELGVIRAKASNSYN